LRVLASILAFEKVDENSPKMATKEKKDTAKADTVKITCADLLSDNSPNN
jgi:hypothetical protein